MIDQNVYVKIKKTCLKYFEIHILCDLAFISVLIASFQWSFMN